VAHAARQHRPRELERIHLRGEPGEDRTGAAATESPFELHRVEPFAVEADRAARRELRAQSADALLVAGEIETLAPFVVRVRQQLGKPRLHRRERIRAGAIRERGPVGSQRLREVRQMRVDLVLQQGCRCRRAAEPRFARVEHDDASSRRDQPVRDQRARNSGTHDGDVEIRAGVVALRVADTIAHEPVRLGGADAMRDAASEGPHADETRASTPGSLWVSGTDRGSVPS
jgi:hypothetical protein